MRKGDETGTQLVYTPPVRLCFSKHVLNIRPCGRLINTPLWASVIVVDCFCGWMKMGTDTAICFQ